MADIGSKYHFNCPDQRGLAITISIGDAFELIPRALEKNAVYCLLFSSNGIYRNSEVRSKFVMC